MLGIAAIKGVDGVDCISWIWIYNGECINSIINTNYVRQAFIMQWLSFDCRRSGSSGRPE